MKTTPEKRVRVAVAIVGAGLLVSAAAAFAQTAGPALRVNTYTADDQQSPAIASDAAGNSVVVWQSEGEDGSLFGIYAQRYSAAGARIGREFRVNTHTDNLQILPAVAMNAGGAFVVVWDSVGQDGNGLSIYGQRYAANGAALGGEFRIDSSTNDKSTQVGVAIDTAGDFAVVWPEHFTSLGASPSKVSLIELRLYTASGNARGNSIGVATSLTDSLRVPVVAMNDSNVVVAWDAIGRGRLLSGPAGIGVGIRAKRFDADGSVQGSTIDVSALDANTVVDRPSITIDAAGNFAIAWETLGVDLSAEGVHARRYAAGGSAIAAEFAVGDGDKLQRNPSITMNAAGSFAVAAHGNGIYLQRYDENAKAAGATLRVDDMSGAAGGSLSPAATLAANGKLVVAWQDYRRDGDGRGIAARIYSAP